MKRKIRRLNLRRETLAGLDHVAGGSPPTEFGSDCAACITIKEVPSGGTCITNPCPTGYASICGCSDTVP